MAAIVLFIVGMIILVRAVKNKPGEVVAPGPIDVEVVLTIDESLRQLKQSEFFDQLKAAKALAGMNVDHQRRGEVVAALKGALDNPHRHVPRNEILEALAHWATAAEVPYFIRMMDDEDGNAKVRAMSALGKLKDARGVDPLAQRLADSSYRRIASQALKDIGPAAEKAVAEYLDNPDYGLRIEACGILKVIGTPASHAALIKLAWDDNQGLAQAAREALPPDQRPPIYGLTQTMYLNVHVPDLAIWPAIEKKLHALTEGKPVFCKYGRSGEYMSVRLAPVTADPTAFAARIDFGAVGTIHTPQRLIYVNNVK